MKEQFDAMVYDPSVAGVTEWSDLLLNPSTQDIHEKIATCLPGVRVRYFILNGISSLVPSGSMKSFKVTDGHITARDMAAFANGLAEGAEFVFVLMLGCLMDKLSSESAKQCNKKVAIVAPLDKLPSDRVPLLYAVSRA